MRAVPLKTSVPSSVYSAPSVVQKGFTLIELLTVIAIIAILIGLLLPALARARASARRGAARHTMNTIVMALEKYRDDFKYYPPDDKLGATPLDTTQPDAGSKLLAYYLCQRFADGETHFGPYLDLSSAQLKGGQQFVSPLGGFYRYKLFTDDAGNPQSYLAADPGEDKLFGLSSTMTADGSDTNADGVPDDKDNIYSSDPG
jgi:prepilin-type N-terminal cleavage/methylation domain-containing protein